MFRKSYKDRFQDDFEHGMEFWTGSDGTLMELVVSVRPVSPSWQERIRDCYLFKAEKFDESRARRGYVDCLWKSERPDFDFDDTARKIWVEVDYETPFEVMFYDLEIKR